MAEIILEPIVQSKVIPLSLRLNDTDTSLVSQLVTNRQFSTADTDAWFRFTLEGLATTTGTFNLTLINLHDKSVFNHTDKVFNTNPFYYKLDSGTDELTNEVRHAGKWVGQLVVTLANGDSATRKFIFGIEGHILDGTVVQTILLEDYNTLITSIESAKDELTQYNIDYSTLISTVESQEASMVQAEITRTQTFNALVDSEIIAQNVATELQNVESTYAPRLLSAEQQLAHLATVNVLAFGSVGDANYYNPSNNEFYTDRDYTILSTDNTTAFKLAAEKANNEGLTLHIPDGYFYVEPDAMIDIKSNVICDGIVRTKNSGTNRTFNFKKDQDLIPVNISTPLTKGRTIIPELNNYMGYGLIIKSTDVDIVRNLLPETATNYYKGEVNRITRNGGLEKPLLFDYQTGIEVFVVPIDVEKDISLRVETYGEISGTGRTITRNHRSNVRLKLYLKNMTGRNQRSMFYSANAIDVTLDKGNISGAEIAPYGYATTFEYCYNVHFNDTVLVGKHVISGSYTREVYFNGGSYTSLESYVFDSHFGIGDFKVSNANIVSKHSIFSFTGYGDLELNGCKVNLLGGNLYTQRSDSPSHKGKVKIKDVELVDNSDVTYLQLFARRTGTTFPHSRTLDNPNIVIENLTIDANNRVSSGIMILSFGMKGEAQTEIAPSDVSVKTMRIKNANGSLYITQGTLYNDTVLGDINVEVDGVYFEDSDISFETRIGFEMHEDSTKVPNNRVQYHLKNVGRLYINGDTFHYLNSTFEGSTIHHMRPRSSTNYEVGNLWDYSPNKTLKFIDCVFHNPNGSNALLLANLYIKNCHFVKFSLRTLTGNNVSELDITSVSGCTFETDSISSGGLESKLYNRTSKSNLDSPRTTGYRVLGRTPVSYIQPNYIGEMLLDSVGKTWYIATGLDHVDWKTMTV